MESVTQQLQRPDIDLLAAAPRSWPQLWATPGLDPSLTLTSLVPLPFSLQLLLIASDS